MSGNSNRSCLRCLHCQKEDGLYDCNHVQLRDVEATKLLCIEGSAALRKKESGCPLLQAEINTLKALDHQSVHPVLNATFNVPMGFTDEHNSNHLYNTPPDLLHTFMCGLMKNVLLWVVAIILRLGVGRNGDLNFKNSRSLLDSRMGYFKNLCKLPNVTTTYFKKGITFISGNKSNAAQASETGGAAGMRSSEFVMALLLLYFAVGFEGDVVPNERDYNHNGERVGKQLTYFVSYRKLSFSYRNKLNFL